MSSSQSYSVVKKKNNDKSSKLSTRFKLNRDNNSFQKLSCRDLNTLFTSVHNEDTKFDLPLLSRFIEFLDPNSFTQKNESTFSSISKVFGNQFAYQYSSSFNTTYPSSTPLPLNSRIGSFSGYTTVGSSPISLMQPPMDVPSKSIFQSLMHKLGALTHIKRPSTQFESCAVYQPVSPLCSPSVETARVDLPFSNPASIPTPNSLLDSYKGTPLINPCQSTFAHSLLVNNNATQQPSTQKPQVILTTPVSNYLETPINSSNSPTGKQTEALNTANYLHLIIKAHESNEMELSYKYLLDAQKNDPNQPLIQFLKGIYLRHGWGCVPNLPDSYNCLYQALKLCMATLIPTNVEGDIAIKGENTQERPISSYLIVLKPPSDVAKYRDKPLPPPPFKPSPFKSMLALILFEISASLKFGWGSSVQGKLAFQVMQLSANLGDMDACLNVGLYAFNHNDKLLAARYLRWASFGGWSDVGMGWIFKVKYDEVCSNQVISQQKTKK